AKWNDQHAHVLSGSRSSVLQEFRSTEGHLEFKLLSSVTFHEWNGEHTMVVQKDGKDVIVQQTKYWIAHPQRRKYLDLGFFPSRDIPGFYNLWRGFAIEPRKGDCSKFLTHIHENVCQNNSALYDWVIAWFADIFQHPDKKCGTSLALRGKQGVGKTKLGAV